VRRDIKYFTDQELMDELWFRNDHVCIELVKDLDDNTHICREKYKGEFDIGKQNGVKERGQ